MKLSNVGDNPFELIYEGELDKQKWLRYQV